MMVEEMVTHPDKVFWREEGYTKLDLARFYDAVFPKLQPWMEPLPISRGTASFGNLNAQATTDDHDC